MTINGKTMDELLAQADKKNQEIQIREDELRRREESVRWIKWTVPASVVLILAWLYLIWAPRAETSRTDISSSSTQWVEHSEWVAVLNFRSVLTKQPPGTRFSHIWGKENITFANDHEFRVFYPKGSYSPSSDPRWGAGFIYKLDAPVDTARLSYKIKFEKGFDFVKWGKLPGFCALDCPRGGSDIGGGFSTRFMWRQYGDLEWYLYIPGKEGAYGKSFGKGSFRFEPGKYYKLEQSLTLNTPGKNDGSLVIYVDEKEVFRDMAVKFREWADVHIDSMLFSTFFGGSDGSYAATKDTSAYFKDFLVSY